VKPAGRRRSPRAAPSEVITELRARLDEAEDTLRAIRSGGVDALVVAGRGGPRVYTLEGADHAYRLLIESMNEGALVLTAEAMILYANRRFARMLKRPLARIMGHSIYQYLTRGDQEALRPLLKPRAKPTLPIQVLLQATDRLQIPAQISVRRLAGKNSDRATFSVVVTDMTEARRSESMLRSLSHSLLWAQETERRRLAVTLHNRATQNLVALLIRLRMLADKLPAPADALRGEVAEIILQVGDTANFVEKISRNLRPSVLEILGLVPALRAVIAEFVNRTNISVTLACTRVTAPLSAEIELMLYRILEESMKNLEKHEDAHKVTVHLRQKGAAVELVIKDDGVGCDSDRPRAGGKRNDDLGLIGLRERAASVGGALRIKSKRGAGTEIKARIPVPTGRVVIPRR